MNFLYQSKLFKQLIVVICSLVILAIAIPSIVSMQYITPRVVEERYHQVMINDVNFLASRLDLLLEKGLDDVEFLSGKISISNPAEIQEAGDTLVLSVRSSTVFTGGVVTDEKGIVQLHFSLPEGLMKLTQEHDVSYRDYIKYALVKNQPYLSDVTTTRGNSLPVVFVSNPVIENGQTIGVLALSINLWNEENLFYSLFHGFHENKQGNIYVVDSQGTIVYHRNKENVGSIVNQKILSELDAKKVGISEDIRGQDG